jgi:hypothetical protein
MTRHDRVSEPQRVIEELNLPAPWTDLLDDLHALKRVRGSGESLVVV